MNNLPLNFHSKTPIKDRQDLWNQNTEYAIKKIPSLVEPGGLRENDTVAIVGLGPSLLDTWEDIKRFKYVISVSGAHKFLIDRGIIPTWHVEVDSREHKIDLMGPPHPDVEYLIAGVCHPKLIDHLQGFKVRLWHPNLGPEVEDRLSAIPPKTWRINGGSDVASRAIMLAVFMGFPKINLFGIDCSYPSEDYEGEHAVKHPNKVAIGNRVTTTFNGKTYYTTPVMLTSFNDYIGMRHCLKLAMLIPHGQGLLQDAFRADLKPSNIDDLPDELWIAVR